MRLSHWTLALLVVATLFSPTSSGQQESSSTETGIAFDLFTFDVQGLAVQNTTEGLLFEFNWDFHLALNALPNLQQTTVSLSVWGLEVIPGEEGARPDFQLRTTRAATFQGGSIGQTNKKVLLAPSSACSDDFLTKHQVFELVVTIESLDGIKNNRPFNIPQQSFTALLERGPAQDCTDSIEAGKRLFQQKEVLSRIPKTTLDLEVSNPSLQIEKTAIGTSRVITLGTLRFDFSLAFSSDLTIVGASALFIASGNTQAGDNITETLLHLSTENSGLEVGESAISSSGDTYLLGSEARSFSHVVNDFCTRNPFRDILDPQLDVTVDVQAVRTIESDAGPGSGYRLVLATPAVKPDWTITGRCPNNS